MAESWYKIKGYRCLPRYGGGEVFGIPEAGKRFKSPPKLCLSRAKVWSNLSQMATETTHCLKDYLPVLMTSSSSCPDWVSVNSSNSILVRHKKSTATGPDENETERCILSMYWWHCSPNCLQSLPELGIQWTRRARKQRLARAYHERDYSGQISDCTKPPLALLGKERTKNFKNMVFTNWEALREALKGAAWEIAEMGLSQGTNRIEVWVECKKL